MASTDRSRLASVFPVLLWLVIVAESIGMGVAGGSKFANPTLWTSLFVGWGYPAWFAYVVGAVEVVGALLLLVPRISGYAAGALMAVMLGALGTVLTHPGEMGPVAPAIHLALLAVILFARWRVRWTGRPTVGT